MIMFLRDDTEIGKVKELNEILEELEGRNARKEVIVARRFLLSMMRVAKNIKEPEKVALNYRVIEKEINKEQKKPVHVEELIEEEPHKEDNIETLKGEYPLIITRGPEGDVFAQANLAMRDGEINYNVQEPNMDRQVLMEVKKLISKDFSKNHKVIDKEKYLKKKLKKAGKELKRNLSNVNLKVLHYYLHRDYIGLGKLDPLIHDSNLTAIICDGANRPVKVRYGTMEMRTNVEFENDEELNSLIMNIAEKMGKEAGIENPNIEGMMDYFKITLNLGINESTGKIIIERLL